MPPYLPKFYVAWSLLSPGRFAFCQRREILTARRERLALYKAHANNGEDVLAGLRSGIARGKELCHRLGNKRVDFAIGYLQAGVGMRVQPGFGNSRDIDLFPNWPVNRVLNGD